MLFVPLQQPPDQAKGGFTLSRSDWLGRDIGIGKIGCVTKHRCTDREGGHRQPVVMGMRKLTLGLITLHTEAHICICVVQIRNSSWYGWLVVAIGSFASISAHSGRETTGGELE